MIGSGLIEWIVHLLTRRHSCIVCWHRLSELFDWDGCMYCYECGWISPWGTHKSPGIARGDRKFADFCHNPERRQAYGKAGEHQQGRKEERWKH